jgi:peptidoglycan/xylan/chitin deacetylase (PgdA/CDA1 family)
MKKLHVLLFVLLVSGSMTSAQSVDSLYAVGTWSGFRDAAISYTFDDGCSGQFSSAIPMFNEFGFTLTLFTVTGTSWSPPPNWTALQNAADQGHEIACHTVTHPRLDTLSLAEQYDELHNSQDAIDAHVTGQKCLTLAYPYCVHGNDSLCAEYFIAARACQGSIERSTPVSMLNISSLICGDEGGTKTADNFNSRANSAAGSNGWCVYLIHGIDSDGGWSPTSSDELRGSLEYLDENRDTFWVATFLNVVLYIMERNAVSVTETVILDSSITVQITDTLDNEIYNYPVTIRRQLPESWVSAVVRQNGQTIGARVVEENGVRYIQFDAVPDGGDVLITESDITTDVRNQGSLKIPASVSLWNYPNPFNPVTTIAYRIPQAGNITLGIYNNLGQCVRTMVNKWQSAGHYQVRWDATDGVGKPVSAGVYYYRLEGDNVSKTEQMIFLK